MIGYLYRRYKFKNEFKLNKVIELRLENFNLSISGNTLISLIKNYNVSHNVTNLLKDCIHEHIKINKLENIIEQDYLNLIHKNIIYGTNDFLISNEMSQTLKIEEFVLLLLEDFKEKNSTLSNLSCHSIEAYLNGNLKHINDILQRGSDQLYSDFMKESMIQLADEYKKIYIKWNESTNSNLLNYDEDFDYGLNSEESLKNYNKKKSYSENFKTFFSTGNIISMLEKNKSIVQIDNEEFELNIGKYIYQNSYQNIEVIFPKLDDYYISIEFIEMKNGKPVFKLFAKNLNGTSFKDYDIIKKMIINKEI